jgi:hypothetical protein
MYVLIFNPQKVLLNKPKDLLILQMFCQFPNDFVKLNLSVSGQERIIINRTFCASHGTRGHIVYSLAGQIHKNVKKHKSLSWALID